VSAGSQSLDLVAAYGFDEGTGSVLTDLSGHGNSGRIHGATWTARGKFGTALDFDGGGSVVLIPPSPSLDLTQAMTLEAWIQPTATQTGWRAILHGELDSYFLFSGSRAGALKPGGGGTFGSSTELMASPAPVPTNAWTHVALTYDGAVLQLYLDGRLVARRLRWYPGRVPTAALDGMPIPVGGRVESRAVRERLRAGATLHVEAVASAPVPTLAPLVNLLDPFRNEILLVAAEGDDLVFHLRTRADAVGFDSPMVHARGAMRGLTPGSDLLITLSRAGRTYCLTVNTRPTCGLGFTFGMGWTLFLSSQLPPGWPHVVLNTLWMAGLLFPFGFWLRRRWESLLGALLLAASVMVTYAVGHLNITAPEFVGASVGILAGCGCWLATARHTLRELPDRLNEKATGPRISRMP
jgi:hypothetical protein